MVWREKVGWFIKMAGRKRSVGVLEEPSPAHKRRKRLSPEPSVEDDSSEEEMEDQSQLQVSQLHTQDEEKAILNSGILV